MFKILVPIQKSYESSDGKKLIVSGVASSPVIDREEERFTVEAIKKMSEDVMNGNLPIRLEHENKVYTDIGVWKSAYVDKNDQLVVEGELDLEFSLAKDISVLLKRGKTLALSVGGFVNEVGYEFAQEIGRSIRVYKDIALQEISIVKNPANASTSLSMAKSIDWQDVEKTKGGKPTYTTKAQKAIEAYKSMQKVEPKAYKALGYQVDILKTDKAERPTGWKEAQVTKMALWSSGVEKKLVEEFAKCEMCEDDYYDDDMTEMESGYATVSPEDMMFIAALSRVMAEVELPTDDEVNEMMSSDVFWEMYSSIGEDGFIILKDRMKVLPHHNTDYTVNRDYVLYQLKVLLDNQSYWSPADYKVAFYHLYNHLKEFQIIKSKRETLMLKKEQIVQLYGAFRFSKSMTTERPTTDGREMSDEEVKAAADAFTKVADSKEVLDVLKELETTEAPVATEPEKLETVPEGSDVPTVTEVHAITTEAPGGEAPATEVPVEAPVAEVPVTEVVPETVTEVPATEPEVTPVAETPSEEVTKALEVQKAHVEKAVSEAVAKATSEFAGKMDAIAKSLKDTNEALSAVTEATQEFAVVKQLVEALASQPLARKSIASFAVLEKTMKDGSDFAGKSAADVAVELMKNDATLSFTKAYQTAKEMTMKG